MLSLHDNATLSGLRIGSIEKLAEEFGFLPGHMMEKRG